jgi:hypothetical protein
MLDGGWSGFPEIFLWHMQMVVLCVFFNQRANLDGAKLLLLKMCFVLNAVVIIKLHCAEMAYPAVALPAMFVLFKFLEWARAYVDQPPASKKEDGASTYFPCVDETQPAVASGDRDPQNDAHE